LEGIERKPNEILSGIILEGLKRNRKPSVRVSGVLAEIRAKNLLNTGLEYYQ
jgi:hypothetical protein